MIEISGVSVSFGGLHALQDVSLTIGGEPGQGAIFGLIGPNGAGKTTLLNSLTGYVGMAAGQITVDGIDVTNLPMHRRARLGIVRSFQTVRLLEEETLYLNLVLGTYRFNRRLMLREMCGLTGSRRAAQRAEISRTVEVLGLSESDLKRPVSELPFGLRRMAELGRVILARPRLALFDEPAAGLAEGQRQKLSEVLRWLAVEQGVTVIMTEHDIDLVRSLCTEVAVLASGKKIAHGKPAETLLLPEVQFAYFGERQET